MKLAALSQDQNQPAIYGKNSWDFSFTRTFALLLKCFYASGHKSEVNRIMGKHEHFSWFTHLETYPFWKRTDKKKRLSLALLDLPEFRIKYENFWVPDDTDQRGFTATALPTTLRFLLSFSAFFPFLPIKSCNISLLCSVRVSYRGESSVAQSCVQPKFQCNALESWPAKAISNVSNWGVIYRIFAV